MNNNASNRYNGNSRNNLNNRDPRFERYSEKENIANNRINKKKNNKKVVIASVICLLLVLVRTIATYRVSE